MSKIETIDAATYAAERAICDKAQAYADSIMKAESRNYLTADEAAHPDYSACDNDMRGRVEQFEILRDLPPEIIGYVSGGQVTVWTGRPISTQLYAGSAWRVSSGYGSVMTQYHAVIGGREYTGRGLGEGMAIRLRETAATRRRREFADKFAGDMRQNYIAAMLWSTHDESDDDGGVPMDSKYNWSDLTAELFQSSYDDCWQFLYKTFGLVTPDNYVGRSACLYESDAVALAGHDFWLTRAGHGAGFWDGDWKSDSRSGFDGPLTRAAKAFGSIDPYVTDSGEISA